MDPIAFSRIATPSLVPLPETPVAKKDEASFVDLLTDASARLEELQGGADTELRRLLAGEEVDLHRVLLANEKAGLASQLMMSVRNKVVDAYQEIMRMQV